MTMAHDNNQTRNPTTEELNAALPRKVRLYSDDARRLYWFVVFLLGSATIWFAYYCHHAFMQSKQREALHSEGREVLGEVTGKNQNRSGVFVHYLYEVGGIAYKGEAELPINRHVDASVDQPIRILYLPSEPSVSHPSGWNWSAEWDIVPNIIVLVFAGIGVIGAVMLYRDRALARKGWVVEGRVKSCVPSGRRFSVYYEFHTGDKDLMEGSNDYWDECEINSPIFIIYLRSNPKRNDCYPLASYRAV